MYSLYLFRFVLFNIVNLMLYVSEPCSHPRAFLSCFYHVQQGEECCKTLYFLFIFAFADITAYYLKGQSNEIFISDFFTDGLLSSHLLGF
jgi:hypothetical protein